MKIKTGLYLLLSVCFLLSCQGNEKKLKQSQYHHRMAEGFIKQCDRPRALSSLLLATKLNPKDSSIKNSLASVYYSMRQLKKAFKEFENILKRKPKLTEARVNLARVYIDLSQPEKALKELKRAEKDITYTNYLKLISWKALAYFETGQYREAKKWTQEALSLPGGKSCFLQRQMGEIELALKHFEPAENALKTALSICGEEAKIVTCQAPSYKEHLLLAQFYIETKDKNRAKYHLNLLMKKSTEKSLLKQAESLLQQFSP